jgi:peroxiredoxin
MLRENQAAPDFTLEAMDGSRLSLQETLAKGPALLVFLKISCPVCQYALPFVERMKEAAEASGIQFLVVSQDNAASTEYFLKDHGITFPALLDTYDSRYAVSNAYGIRSVPSAFLIETDGVISLTMEGFEKAPLEELGARIGSPPFRGGENIPAFKPG